MADETSNTPPAEAEDHGALSGEGAPPETTEAAAPATTPAGPHDGLPGTVLAVEVALTALQEEQGKITAAYTADLEVARRLPDPAESKAKVKAIKDQNKADTKAINDRRHALKQRMQDLRAGKTPPPAPPPEAEKAARAKAQAELDELMRDGGPFERSSKVTRGLVKELEELQSGRNSIQIQITRIQEARQAEQDKMNHELGRVRQLKAILGLK